ncbi:MAG: pilus assembly PilX family protein [Telluria sp.]
MMPIHLARQRGIALPVMLIILLVMLISSIYLLKASNSSTLAAVNLAYDSTQSRAADLGLYTGFDWLRTTAATNKPLLNADSAANGYLATLDTTQGVRDAAFWNGSKVVVDANGKSIEYVIHRLCAMPGAYDAANNACVQTAANTATVGNTVALGDSLASDAPSFASTPQVHYVITARVSGARGGNAVNQLVVLIGA